MKSKQFLIRDVNDNEIITFGDDVILFDTQEEAEEMITYYSMYFCCPKSLEIVSGLYFIDESINYRDLVKDKTFLEVIKEINELENM